VIRLSPSGPSDFPTEPGPEPCNQIPATYAEAVALARLGRSAAADDPLAAVRCFLARDVERLAAALLELAIRLDRIERRLGVRR
jgi:hypothetical protein